MGQQSNGENYMRIERLLNEIITVMQNGGAEVDDLVKFYFPTLSDEERAEKIARINESKQASTESSILSALNM